MTHKCVPGVHGTLFNVDTFLLRGWGKLCVDSPCIGTWFWSFDGCIRRVDNWGRQRPSVMSRMDLWIILRGFTCFGSLFGKSFSRRRGMAFLGFDLDMTFIFFDDFSPSEGWTFEVWVGIYGSTNFKTSSCFTLNGDLEGRESNICWCKHQIGPKDDWFGRR